MSADGSALDLSGLPDTELLTVMELGLYARQAYRPETVPWALGVLVSTSADAEMKRRLAAAEAAEVTAPRFPAGNVAPFLRKERGES